ncbi:MAG: S-layer homology domain-containing protein, partial [Syntrophomonadaceae bacterium]|nr:S-layer homology domain-containing protein [Syntrophomonadaceae bacterium]
MLRKKRPLIVWVLTLLFLLSSAGIAGAAPVDQAQQTGATPFTDGNSTDKNAVYINYMAKRGLINGFPDGTYHPGEGLTRAQAAVLFCKIRGLNPTEKNSTFNDVVGNHWAAGYIAAAVKAGYITGFPDGTYRPQAILTRAQGINLFLQLATEKDSSEEIPALQDLDKNHWAANSIAIALAAGMIEAQDSKIQPEQPFARGDLARALSILLTKDPGLSQQELIGKLQVKNGTVEIKRAGSEKVQTINTASIVRKGDTITTGKDGQVEINYPDGSGILLKPDSELIIKTSIGRAYIV